MKTAIMAVLLAVMSVSAVAQDHKFFDKENKVNFIVLTAAATGDAITTQRFLAPERAYKSWKARTDREFTTCMGQLSQGKVEWCEQYQTTALDRRQWQQEANPLARPLVNRGWAGQAVYTYGYNVGGTMALAYLAHRTGHHTIERWIPRIQMAENSLCVGWNLSIHTPRIPAWMH